MKEGTAAGVLAQPAPPHTSLPFAEVFDDWVRRASLAFSDHPLMSERALVSAQRELTQLLTGICGWPLLIAFQVLRQADSPGLSAAKDKAYTRFVRRLRDGALDDFLSEYPELSRLAELCVRRWQAAYLDLLGRLEHDCGDLVKMFGVGAAGRIAGIDPALSDRHQGRTVIGVTLTSGLKLIYKPRAMALEHSYFALLDWLNKNGAPVDHRVVRVLERAGYGWAEHVDHEPCQSAQEVRDYFVRAGASQCLLYVLHATDAHMGNVIAARAHPVLVDGECLLQPMRTGVDRDPDREALEALLTAAFLPRPKVIRGEALDFSGLAGDAGRTTEFRIPVWSHVNTDAMALGFGAGVLVPQPNAPVLDGVRSSVADYSTEFLSGFEQMHRYLADRRHALLARGGPLDRMLSCDARVLLRSTRSYLSLINRSLHPRYLRDSAGRSAMLRSAVFRQTLDLHPRALEAEVAALRDLDVPHAMVAAREKTLVVENGFRMRGYFDTSSRQIMESRISALNEDNLRTQGRHLRSLFGLFMMSGQ